MFNNVPKTIHYCWFGGAEKSSLIQKCMESWKKFCSDFEFIEWNETNFDINCCKYVKEAYENKKWAFVSDYCRLYVLEKYGGVYLDTDVELIKPINDLLSTNFVGFEDESAINPGLVIGVKKGNTILKTLLDEYTKDSFVLENGKLNYRTICDRFTDEMEKHGLVRNGRTQEIAEFKIYSVEYFNPYDRSTGRLNITSKTYSIHNFLASWQTFEHQFENANAKGKIVLIFRKIFGKKITDKIVKLLKKGDKEQG